MRVALYTTTHQQVLAQKSDWLGDGVQRASAKRLLAWGHPCTTQGVTPAALRAALGGVHRKPGAEILNTQW